MKRRVVFLDRDGTLVRDRPGFYLRRPEQLRLYPFAAQALKLLRRAGYRLVVVTNQSGLARRYLDRATLGRIHARLRRELRRRGASIDAIYFCPHAPEGSCRCRKPSPLLARRAVRELHLTLNGAAVVGDKQADIDMARRLGIASIHVRTGHGRSQQVLHGHKLRPTHSTRNVLTAARWLLRHAVVAGALCFFIPLPPIRAADPPAPISSATVRQPYDLIGGTAAPTAELSSVPWFHEFLEFQVQWGIFDVGVSNLQALRVDDFNGTPAVRIVSEAKSNSFCDAFYKVRDLNESWIDARAFHSLGYSKRLREGKFFRDEWVVYDYAAKKYLSKRTNRDMSAEYGAGTIPGPVQDILSSMYFLRTKPLKVGDEVTLDVNTKSTWPLVVKVLRKEHVTVPAGKFDCVVVEPFLRQEGIFVQKGKHLQVWMTDDARHLPVLMSVEVFFGHVTASLSKISKP